ncbi:FecR family protein [Caulobacter soli]|uniref:FecR family protein n=1 Tax=Caulobacter soli TaxID=2708539 RepID=UPI0013EC8FA9|nr:FecR domain-containing protein [Caulobacter soli]
MSAANQIEATAARWLLRREDADWSAEDQARLDAWLDAAPAHKVAYWRLEQGWQRLDRLAALRAPASVAPSPRALLAWRPAALAAACAVMLVLGGTLVSRAYLPVEKSYATEVGGRAVVPLPDGSKVELNTATRLRAAVHSKTREVWLDRGEAYFEVAHDKSRPFVVHAGTKTVTVLGTKFSVRREGDRVEVAVVEGRVRVADSRPTHSPAPAPDLTRGEIVIAQGPSTLVAEKSVDRVTSELGWRQGVIYFDQSTLGEAAREFNRYNRKQVVVDDAELARMRIGGNFEATDVDAFLRLLQQAYGLKIDDDGAVAKISS